MKLNKSLIKLAIFITGFLVVDFSLEWLDLVAASQFRGVALVSLFIMVIAVYISSGLEVE